MLSLKRAAQSELNGHSKRPRREPDIMSISSSSEPSLPLHALPPPPPVDGGLFARVMAGVQDFANDFWTAFTAPSSTANGHSFDFDNTNHERAAKSTPSSPTRRTNGHAPRRAYSQTSSVASVPSTSASQLDSSLALHDHHLRFTRKMSDASSSTVSGGIQKQKSPRRPVRHQHIFAGQHKRQVRDNITKEIFALQRQRGASPLFDRVAFGS
ncbi:hypothetical protein EXIGLDRAFT_511579 [Exidia glandulosa HHB12029]|uniref:Uncharacterized protein n=1 Tax=Exidia glandulosa HHB12029 TaxID=1314781 RepID=A0A165PE86_EXIGL|nr:hypothetical protein EXIGLDRAFT_511579 [Exidia glandulosa HHB12029]